MFKPATEKLDRLAQIYPKTIEQLEEIFSNPSAVYIDFANVFHWRKKLHWHIDLKRLKQLFSSFDTIKAIHFYNGVIPGDVNSEKIIKDAQRLGYQVTSKPVKKMHLSIDVSGIAKNSPSVLQNFIKRALLKKFSVETIEYLNNQLEDLNNRSITSVEHWKCNFDVEIGRDLLIDHTHNGMENFILWSGDSDFADPVNQLIKDGKSVTIFATARRVSPELSATGVRIFEIWKIKEFICWNRERKSDFQMSKKAKRTPRRALKPTNDG